MVKCKWEQLWMYHCTWFIDYIYHVPYLVDSKFSVLQRRSALILNTLWNSFITFYRSMHIYQRTIYSLKKSTVQRDKGNTSLKRIFLQYTLIPWLWGGTVKLLSRGMDRSPGKLSPVTKKQFDCFMIQFRNQKQTKNIEIIYNNKLDFTLKVLVYCRIRYWYILLYPIIFSPI